MTQTFEVLQSLVRQNVIAINHHVLVYSSLKDILVRLHKLDYLEADLSDVDIRTTKGKALILQQGKAFAHATLISKHNLLKRNWTNSLISEYIKYPDVVLRNEKVKMGKEGHLYSFCRVRKLETIPELAQKLRSNEAAGFRTEESNQTSIAVIIKNIDFNIKIIPLDKLVSLAISHYNKIRAYETSPASILCSPDKLERICMNYLRHECSSYEEQFTLIFDIRDYSLACSLLKERVNNEIRQLYPDLKNNIYKHKLRVGVKK
jgi:hypothetical protein